jgi:hypothetical protein
MTLDEHEDWVLLADAARTVNRDPRVLRRWAADGMRTKVIDGARHVKLRYVILWAQEHPRRPRRSKPPP